MYTAFFMNKMFVPHYIAQQQREKVQQLKEQLIAECTGVDKQLDELQSKQAALNQVLTELRLKSCSQEDMAMVKLEEERLLKELQPLLLASTKLQERRKKLADQQCWVKALKYEIYKGKHEHNNS